MDWVAVPDQPTEPNDYRDTLWMVPDVKSYSEGVESLDFAASECRIAILDDDNDLLEEISSEEDADDDGSEKVEPDNVNGNSDVEERIGGGLKPARGSGSYVHNKQPSLY